MPTKPVTSELDRLLEERQSLRDELDALKAPPELVELEARERELSELIDGDEMELSMFAELDSVRSQIHRARTFFGRKRAQCQERLREVEGAISREVRAAYIDATDKDYGEALRVVGQANDLLVRLGRVHRTHEERSGRQIMDVALALAVKHVATAHVALLQSRYADEVAVRHALADRATNPSGAPAHDPVPPVKASGKGPMRKLTDADFPGLRKGAVR